MNNYTLFKRFHGNIFFNPEKLPDFGVVFILSWWSKSRLYLHFLISIADKYSDIPLYIYDSDESQYKKFEEKYGNKSHGMGETFWLKNAKIIGDIKKYDNEKYKIQFLFETLNE